ncbi:hypothetical protein M433DRAFT_68894 [Acidomyces richmondensis BFW]|nr:MAG: hypothetical protein FE78DRAFT_151209 [Acidomyces sp. 'richmondensis']KYG44669.1 hypothetical protein M433DRAFT_68894 [Acidomyces richmondensis BFW]
MRPLLRTTPFPKFVLPHRAFTTPNRLRIKEDADRKPEGVERAKQEQVRKQQQGKGEWHEELASASESSVAADREDVPDEDGHMKELQKKTAGKAEREHPEGKA